MVEPTASKQRNRDPSVVGPQAAAHLKTTPRRSRSVDVTILALPPRQWAAWDHERRLWTTDRDDRGRAHSSTTGISDSSNNPAMLQLNKRSL